jgi:hypothetical protein
MIAAPALMMSAWQTPMIVHAKAQACASARAATAAAREYSTATTSARTATTQDLFAATPTAELQVMRDTSLVPPSPDNPVPSHEFEPDSRSIEELERTIRDLTLRVEEMYGGRSDGRSTLLAFLVERPLNELRAELAARRASQALSEPAAQSACSDPPVARRLIVPSRRSS